MSQGDVQVIPMEEQPPSRRRESWTERPGEIKGPFRSGYQLSTGGNQQLCYKIIFKISHIVTELYLHSIMAKK